MVHVDFLKLGKVWSSSQLAQTLESLTKNTIYMHYILARCNALDLLRFDMFGLVEYSLPHR